MSDHIYDTVVKTSDGELVSACLRIVRDERASVVSRIILHPVKGSTVEISRAQWESNEDLTSHTTRTGRGIRTVSLQNSQNQTLASVSRQLTDANRSKDLFDSLSIAANQFTGETEEFLDFVAVVQEELRATNGNDLGPLLGPDVAAHFASREEALSRLENLIANATSNLVSQRAELDREFQTRREALEAELLEREEASTQRIAGQEQALASKQSELEALRKEIDDRSSTHARRDDRKELLQALSEDNRLALSSQTTFRRWSVLAGYIGLLAFLGGSLALTWYIKGDSQDPSAAELFKYSYLFSRIGLSLGIVVTLGFLIRWLNTFAAKSATEDFKLKQLQLDVQRASWLVELYFESLAAGDKGGFPEDLMKRLSTGLFTSENVEAESVTASDALASALLGSAGKLRLNVGGNEVELSKSGLRKLAKTPVKGED